MSAVPVLQAAVGSILIVAAGSKLAGRASPEEFLRGLGVAPPPARLVARTLPALELVVGLAVILLPGPASALAATLLGLGFAGVLAVARARGLDRACRCFGVLDTDSATPLALVRAAGVALAAAVLLALQVAGAEPVVPGPAELATGVLLTVVGLAVVALSERIWLFEQRRSRPPVRTSSRPAQEVVR